MMFLEELESYSNRLEAEHGDELKDNKYKCKVLQMLANRNLQTFSAILTLLQNGFADQAYMLFRNMFENRVVSQFILHNNEEVAKQFYKCECRRFLCGILYIKIIMCRLYRRQESPYFPTHFVAVGYE